MSNSVPAIKPIETVWHGYRFLKAAQAARSARFEHVERP
jgi:hypothetical protein